MFDLFRTFMTVYETRSFSLAGQRLFVSQPTISHHIDKLEKALKTQLFIRNKRSATVPTAAADLLYVFSGKLLAQWEKTTEAIHNIQEEAYLELRIGMSQSVATVLFPKIAMALRETFPHLKYDVKVLNSMKVVKQLEAQRIDLGFVEQPLTLKGTTRDTLCPDQLALAGKPTGTWITREAGSGIRFYTDQYLREQAITPRHIMTVNSNAMLQELVQDGIGQALVSDKIAITNVPIKPLGPHFLRNFYLLQNTHNSWPHQKQITQLIKRTAEKTTKS
ncbi:MULTISPECIES: LysR family transcriptional regulator [Lactobacillaceae]|uniref:LysR family transcriptional regulator n=1 Tax=Lactobacillaceae TaxID=33958 RepID=UPI00078C1120|nr:MULTISPECIES: LysR family transcriptional regulator [Lactobacillaceae]AMV70370.1 LysR family transcriptional regulator YeiE [Pediococcus damnosus]MBZ3798709.1 LysR family transcriptional regulator [Lacticaseibacillus paracasei]MCB5223353.1 LysR family transcriptional regulator [Lactiplantibacillus pentosus]